MKIFLLTLVSFLLTILLVSAVYAQLQTESNSVRTKVGNPQIQASSCPIPNGIATCGSRFTPRAGCGHCDASYTSNFGCGYDSLAYALDVAGTYGAEIFLPSISGSALKWTFLDQPKNANNTAIQRWGGINEGNGEQFMIKFHHTAPGSGGGTKYSGEVGARICNAPCDVGTGPHVHIEFAKVNSDGSYTWLDAPLYFCGGNV